jgi:hypothetical protein
MEEAMEGAYVYEAIKSSPPPPLHINGGDWYNMIARFGLIDLIDVLSDDPDDKEFELAKETKEIDNNEIEKNTAITSNCLELFQNIHMRIIDEETRNVQLKEIYKLRTTKISRVRAIRLYKSLYGNIRFIKYLIYNFILNSILYLGYIDGTGVDTLYLYEEFEQPDIKTTTTTSIKQRTDKDKQEFLDKLKKKVDEVYEKDNNRFKNVFFSANSYMQVYDLIYKYLYIEIHKHVDDTITNKKNPLLDSEKLLNDVIDSVINKLVSMDDNGVKMIFAIGLQVPISLYISDEDMDEDMEPLDKDVDEDVDMAVEIAGGSNLNKTIKKLKVKKRASKKKTV